MITPCGRATCRWALRARSGNSFAGQGLHGVDEPLVGPGRIVEEVEPQPRVALGERDFFRLFDDFVGGLEGATQNEVGHVGVFQRHGA